MLRHLEFFPAGADSTTPSRWDKAATQPVLLAPVKAELLGMAHLCLFLFNVRKKMTVVTSLKILRRRDNADADASPWLRV